MLFFVPHPLLSSLRAIEEYLRAEPGKGWQSFSDEQRKLIKEVYAERADLGFFNERQLRTFVGESAAKLNETLKNEGFTIRLGELGENGIGAVSAMKVLFDWTAEAVRSLISADGSRYTAMKFKNGFTVLNAINHDFPIIRLEARGGHEVFISVQGDKRSVPQNGIALQEKIDAIMTYAKPVSSDIEFVKLPVIKTRTDIDVSWMLGLKFSVKGKRAVEIQQAKEQVKLEVDERGVKAEAAAAVGTRGGSEHGLTINEPFFIFIKKAGIKKGILYGLIDASGWVEVPR